VTISKQKKQGKGPAFFCFKLPPNYKKHLLTFFNQRLIKFFFILQHQIIEKFIHWINMKLLFTLLLVSLSTIFWSQSTINIKGQIEDTLNKSGLEHAIIMAIRVEDSVLIDFTRTDFNGIFNIEISRETIQILFTHPKYEDKEFFIFGNSDTKDIDFGRINLPPKGEQLNEIMVFSNNEPIFFRGDTLVMVADSFKTGANANVEDLFKKLPGFDVSNDGKISVHGNQVDKVFVDGDEFFGSDPTIATKNLPASAIEEIEVYEEKKEGEQGETTEKVINLKLKENAKKGAFGKISGASDFTKFYEGEVLLNKFNGDQKISVFGLFTNTPRTSFDWSDVSKYDLGEEMSSYGRHGNWVKSPSQLSGEGLPQKSKTGIYFSDKLGKKKKVKLRTNFSYDNHILDQKSNTFSQYILADTSYNSDKSTEEIKNQKYYAFNTYVSWQIDSLTTFEFQPKIKLIQQDIKHSSSNKFISTENVTTRNTENKFKDKTDYTEAIVFGKLERNFKKKNRKLKLNYSLTFKENKIKEELYTSDQTIGISSIYNITNQHKNGTSDELAHFGELVFTEPLSKKIKLTFNYVYAQSESNNNKNTFDFNPSTDSYDLLNTYYSSKFKSISQTNKGGLKFLHDTKTTHLQLGIAGNQVNLISTDLVADTAILQDNFRWLPFLQFRYSPTRATRYTIAYRSDVENPTPDRLQTIRDNKNPNSVNIGNINLVPQFKREVSFKFFTYKATKGSHTYFGTTFMNWDKGFSTAITFDPEGRSQYQFINVDGNRGFYSYFGSTIPVFKQRIKINPHLNYNYFERTHQINTEYNHVNDQDINGQIDLKYHLLGDSLIFSTGLYMMHKEVDNTLYNNTQIYNTIKYSGGFTYKSPWGFNLVSDISYEQALNRADGYNINLLIWDASIEKTFLEKQNLIISIQAKDLLNQNISNNRIIDANIITDSRTNIVGRYVLLKAIYKFNILKSQKDEGNLLEDNK